MPSWPGKRACCCTSTPVSRPGMVVKFCWPERTSRHTGALLPGWSTLRCCCGSLAGSAAGAGTGVAGFTVCAAAGIENASARISQAAARGSACMNFSSVLLVDTAIFALPQLAILDLFFPAAAIALVPFRAQRQRIVAPGRRIGLPLVLARLGRGGGLLDLHAAGEADQRRGEKRNPFHD